MSCRRRPSRFTGPRTWSPPPVWTSSPRARSRSSATRSSASTSAEWLSAALAVARSDRGPASAAAGELRARQASARGQRRDLLVAHVARRPAEATVGVDVELFRRAHLEDPVDARGHILRRVLVEPLDVDDAGAELAAVAVLLPDVELAQLPPGELEHELVGPGLQQAGEIRRVRAGEARPAEPVAEADVERELGPDTFRRHVEEPRHLLAGHVAASRLVELDELRAGGHETAQLGVDDLGEPLGHVDHARVRPAGVDARAEGERARAGRLQAMLRVGAEVLEVLDQAEARGRGLDAADGLVACLLVVAPRAGHPSHGQRLDVLDDPVVGVDVAVCAPYLAVGDDVEAGALHVADGGVDRVVEHLVEI